MWPYHIRFVCCCSCLHALRLDPYSGKLKLLQKYWRVLFHGLSSYDLALLFRNFLQWYISTWFTQHHWCSFFLLQSKIAQACRVCLKGARLWDSVKELARAYEYVMGLIIFMPVAVLSWFPFVSEFQTRLLFNQAFSRGLQISMILAGKRDTDKNDKSEWHYQIAKVPLNLL